MDLVFIRSLSTGRTQTIVLYPPLRGVQLAQLTSDKTYLFLRGAKESGVSRQLCPPLLYKECHHRPASRVHLGLTPLSQEADYLTRNPMGSDSREVESARLARAGWGSTISSACPLPLPGSCHHQYSKGRPFITPLCTSCASRQDNTSPQPSRRRPLRRNDSFPLEGVYPKGNLCRRL